MATKEFIAAIELGSSKITGIAGKKNIDGSINILAFAKEDSSSFIRRGVVFNIDKAALCITKLVGKLTAQLKAEIAQVYVGVGGQSLRSVRNVITKELAPDTKITQDMVINLMDSNRSMTYSDREILDVVIQEYKVDNTYYPDPVGIQCSRLEGNFLNILQRASFYKSLNECFETAGVRIAEMCIAPVAMADCVLTDPEKRSGCALVDLGASTTTVAVYSKNVLRHLAVIPLGGANITKDIAASQQMDEADAEKMKLQHATAYTDAEDIDDSLSLPIDQDRSIPSRKFIEIVEGRLEEIIKNVWAQIPVEYSGLLGGIILTGGGSKMKNIAKAFAVHTGVKKIRVAKFVNQQVNSHSSDINAKDGTMNTILGLMIKGDCNCAGGDVDPTKGPDIFKTRTKGGNEQARQKQEEEERRKKEEEERRKKEEEERRKKEEEEEERRRKKEKGWMSKVKDKFNKLVTDITEEEE